MPKAPYSHGGNVPPDERPLEYDKRGYSRPAGSIQEFKKHPAIPPGTGPHAARIPPEEIMDMQKVAERDGRAADALRFMARRATSIALSTLCAIAEKGKNEGARVAAAKEILDRGWGKTGVVVDQDARPNQQIKVVFGERPQISMIEADVTDAEAEETDE